MTVTDHSRSADMGELSRAVASLAEALARTKRQSARLIRTIHWSMFGGLVLLVVAGFLIADRIGAAYMSFDRFLFTVEKAIVENADVRKHVGIHREKHGLDPTLVEDEAVAKRVVLEKTIEVLVDAFVVMGNIREDSDSIHDVLLAGFQKLGDDPSATLGNIGKELHAMNTALAAMPPMAVNMEQMSQKMSSVPVMAAQMDLMNRNIASMTHSMGSTMGRVGCEPQEPSAQSQTVPLVRQG